MDSVGSAESTSSGARGQPAEKQPGAVAQRKPVAHPTTVVMVKEALSALDSRQGASSHAIQSYIKQSYPSVDALKLKHLVRNALRKGLENGTLVRPGNADTTTGAQGKFKLAPKVKALKPKGGNADPNVQKAEKAPKDGTKTKKKEDSAMKTSATEKKKASKEVKAPKKPKKDENVPPKAPAAKKPKAKKAKEPEESSASAQAEAAKPTKRKTKVSQEAAKADGEAPAPRRTGKRGKKEKDV
ncbi:hypothetical protein OJAV_G00048050 [Oryzias javanicus]|uniref:H15 domain-containing protein n=1 Tax=Oryzias javanicus TaxID=123683 RepID=A0A3S2PGM9_ORYJA|nr:hypothetical protein OJAV_G00048050 [Oryzias javanicus]